MLHVLCATNRPGANSRKVANYLNARLIQLNGNAALLDLGNLRDDIFSQGSYAEKPDWFELEFQKPILESDGVIVVSPEYNGSFPGVMKYFIDMLKFPESLVKLPVAFIGVAAGQFGGLRAVEQLEVIMHYRQTHIFGERVFIPKVTERIQGETFDPGDLAERLDSFVSGFVEFATALKQK